MAEDKSLDSELVELAEGILVLDADWRVVRVNMKQESAIGRPRATTLGQTLFELAPQLTKDSTFYREYARCMSERVTVEFEEYWAPRDVWMHVEARPLSTGGIVVFFRDVTARRRAQEAQRASEEQLQLNVAALKAAEASLVAQKQLLQSLVDGMPSMVAAFDREKRFVLINDAGARALGEPKASVLGRSAAWGQPPERQAWLHERLEEVMQTGVVQREEVAVPRDGDAPLHLLVTRFPLRGPSGELSGAGVAHTDLTEQKRTEAELRESEARAREMLAQLEKERALTRAAEERLRQAQKMESVGQLAGGIAHDFNNLLTVILGGAEQLLGLLSEPDPMREEVLEIERAGQRAAALTRQLLAFSRKQVLEPRVVDVNVLVRDATRLLDRLLGENIELELVLEPKPAPCWLDPGQFQQILLNLAVNARDAMPDGGSLLIETANVNLDETYAFEHPSVAAGRYIRVSVSDNGHGMSPEVRARLFEPFFTTKEVGRGTGLGLATVYGIVRQSGGAIWVYSEVDQGTTFKIYFPVHEGEATAQPAPSPVATTGGHETILLVEDDAQVRATVARMLRRSGYHVIEASNGGEALLICEQHGGTIHLLLTDVVMPKLNGRKVAERLRALRPALHVLFMSGYTENAIVHHGVLDSGIDFLLKPITTETLLAKVRAVLDREPPSSPKG
ncbi:MAG: PAS domain-containing protein [Polyangiaceae bacterium]